MIISREGIIIRTEMLDFPYWYKSTGCEGYGPGGRGPGSVPGWRVPLKMRMKEKILS